MTVPARLPTATERRFLFLVPRAFAPGVRKMRRDGRVDVWATLQVIDGPTLRQLGVWVSDLVAGGMTDLTLDCAAVRAEDVGSVGLGLVVSLANGLAREARSLTLSNVSDELFAVLDRDGLTTRPSRLGVERAFPQVPSSPEAFYAEGVGSPRGRQPGDADG